MGLQLVIIPLACLAIVAIRICKLALKVPKINFCGTCDKWENDYKTIAYALIEKKEKMRKKISVFFCI